MNRTVTVNGRKYRADGCLERVSKVGDGTFPVFSDDFLIDRKHWSKYKGLSLRPFVHHVIGQNDNSCCGCGTVGAGMICRDLSGLDQVVLSQAVPYGKGNGGRDGGMAIDTGLAMLIKWGSCPIDIVHPDDWRGHNWPKNWEEIAAKYRGIEAWDCPTFEHAVSAVLRGFPVVYGAEGHAVVLVDQELNVLNSWGRDWRDNGFGVWVEERSMRYGIERQYGAFALRTTVDPLKDGDVPNV